jgi:hypothetical protein
LSTILPLNIFSWAAAKVIRSVFFGYDLSPSASSATNCSCQLPNFCLNISSLNSVYPNFQLLSLLLKGSDVVIRRECS